MGGPAGFAGQRGKGNLFNLASHLYAENEMCRFNYILRRGDANGEATKPNPVLSDTVVSW